MKIAGHTNLESLAQLSPELRTLLKSLWVESVEELLALLATVESDPPKGLPGADSVAHTKSMALSLIGPARSEALLKRKPGGALGCRIKPEVMEMFAKERRIGPPRAKAPAGFGRMNLPPSVRLVDELGPVKDQGQRGTCVAFASVALREHLARKEHDFSEQFLYWACKQLDGHDGPGTYIHTAMTALSEYGCCLGRTWPYNHRQIDGNESQHPPPHGATGEAKEHCVANSRPVEPSLVEHYKQVLAGERKIPGMPVVFGVLVFASWYMSAETHRTGKITLPLPGEDPMAGHAMCVVGYQDDDSVPGGGYFVVRNSWGKEWALESPEAPGHALVPYAYVESYVLEAFTGPARSELMSWPVKESDLDTQGFTRTLDQDGRDVEGRLLPANTPVLCHPSVPGEFMEDTLANRTKFLALDCAWSQTTRQKLWFPPVNELEKDLRRRIDVIRSTREKFTSAIDESVVTSVGMPFPQMHIPALYNLIPYEWEPSIKHTQTAADLTGPFFNALKKHSGVRQDLEWPKEWTELLAELNLVRVYSVSGFLAHAYVVMAFVTGITFQRQGQPKIVPPDQALINAVREIFKQWLAEQKLAKPEFTFYSVGASDPVGENVEGSVSGEDWLTVSHLLPDGKWLTKVPPPFSYRLALRDFLDQLEPETRQQRVVRIKACVDELFIEGGNVTVDRVKRETAYRRSVVRHKDEKGYRRSVIREAFFELQKQAPDTYRLFWTKDGQLGIRQAQRGEPIRVASVSFSRTWIRRHALRIIATFVSAGVGIVATVYREYLGLSGFVGLLMAVPVLYAGGCLQAAINRRAEKEKE
jgi:hypothetical protein